MNSNNTGNTATVTLNQTKRHISQAHGQDVKLLGTTTHYVTAALPTTLDFNYSVSYLRIVVSRASSPSVQILLTCSFMVGSTTGYSAAKQKQGQDVERRVLAQAVKWHAEHRVLLNGTRTVIFR